MSSIGNLKKIVDLRTLWAHEEKDFSKWVSENLSMLGDAIELDIDTESAICESAVGNFSIDIFAEEEGTRRKIIIENQLSSTDHDHLGKIITYAAGKNADVIIWIVKQARDEHRQAVEWLNEHTDEEIGVFLIEIELWQIDNSLPAPKFNIVSKPNNWQKTIKNTGDFTLTKQLQLKFWQNFIDYAKNKNFPINLGKAQPQHWYNLYVGISDAHIELTINSKTNGNRKGIGIEVYIPDDKVLFTHFMNNKDKIEKDLGFTMNWQELPDKKASRIICNTNGDLKNEQQWQSIFDWYIEKSVKMKEIFNKYK